MRYAFIESGLLEISTVQSQIKCLCIFPYSLFQFSDTLKELRIACTSVLHKLFKKNLIFVLAVVHKTRR